MDDFDAFFEDHYGAVVRAVSLGVGDPSRGEELTQEAFARAYRRWSTVRDMQNPVAWLYVVALNTERKRWRRDRTGDGESVVVEVVGDPAGAVVTRLALEQGLGLLTARQRSAIVLRFLVDLSVADVARVMGCAEGTVKATLHQALRRLRVELEGSDGER